LVHRVGIDLAHDTPRRGRDTGKLALTRGGLVSVVHWPEPETATRHSASSATLTRVPPEGSDRLIGVSSSPTKLARLSPMCASSARSAGPAQPEIGHPGEAERERQPGRGLRRADNYEGLGRTGRGERVEQIAFAGIPQRRSNRHSALVA
jgi:hypothetical protein